MRPIRNRRSYTKSRSIRRRPQLVRDRNSLFNHIHLLFELGEVFGLRSQALRDIKARLEEELNQPCRLQEDSMRLKDLVMNLDQVDMVQFSSNE
jgi:hypothetical protein